MNRLIGIITMIGVFLILGLFVWFARSVIERVQTYSPLTVREASVSEEVHLPTKCHRYYNDGTSMWIECMGVGYK